MGSLGPFGPLGSAALHLKVLTETFYIYNNHDVGPKYHPYAKWKLF